MWGEIVKQDFKNQQVGQKNNNCIIIFKIILNCILVHKKANMKGQNSYSQEM